MMQRANAVQHNQVSAQHSMEANLMNSMYQKQQAQLRKYQQNMGERPEFRAGNHL